MTVVCSCGKAFKRDAHLDQHCEATHHQVKCICGKAFATVDDRRQHAEAKGCYPTCLCGVVFLTLDALRDHAKSMKHRAMCICGKIFANLPALRQHQQDKGRHIGFVTLDDISSVSKQQPTGPPPNHTDTASKQAKDAVTPPLTSPLGTVPARVSCPLCQKSFKDATGRMAHIRAKHEGQEMSLDTAQAVVVSALDCLPEAAVDALEEAADTTKRIGDGISRASTPALAQEVVADTTKQFHHASSPTSTTPVLAPFNGPRCTLCKNQMIFETEADLFNHLYNVHIMAPF